MFEQIYNFFSNFIGTTSFASLLTIASICLVISIVAFLINILTKSYIVYLVRTMIKKTNSHWANNLIKHRVFHKLSHLSPAIVILVLIPMIQTSTYPWSFKIISVVTIISLIYITLVIVWFLMSFIDSCGYYYQYKKLHSQPSITAYLQLLKIIILITATIIIISIILNKSPLIFLTGIGAISAVLMLVFKDTILGFVSSVQVSTLDMVRVNDWITIPSLNVDGDVTDISINTVKIRNFDKTIMTIPTYSLMSHGVQNWRGMQETGGRRIKRSINIDIDTIQFCNQEILEKLSNLKYLKDYIQNKSEEIKIYNSKNKFNNSFQIDGRNLTNIGLYQTYIENYLKNNINISKELTFLVRQLQHNQFGIPIEIYVFTNITDWIEYEKIQSDIFDHLLAAVSIFDLKVFQIISK